VRVDVVIVSYRSRDLIVRCLDSLRASRDLAPKIMVVDNHSGDGTLAALESAHPDVIAWDSGSNQGFAKSVNAALSLCTADYTLVLNPDTEVPAPTLAHLVQVMDSEPTVGVLGCRLVQLDGSLDKACKRRFPSERDAVRYLVNKVLNRTSSSRYTADDLGEFELGDVDAVNGAFMLLRKSALDVVGPLDERYWMYGEDLDWCRRFRRSGFRVLYDGRVTALHVKGASSGQHRGFRTNWHFHRSMWLFYRDSVPRPGVALSLAALAGISLNWVQSTLGYLLSTVRSSELRTGRAHDDR
jgi:N-acetylglucosaminyl-diphospho-decaprenol L-rhamnosyltransferase